MSSNTPTPPKPKVDKFAALAAAQHQKQQQGQEQEDLVMSTEENTGIPVVTKPIDEETKLVPQNLHETETENKIPSIPQRRDKFASMAAAASVVTSTLLDDGNNTQTDQRSMDTNSENTNNIQQQSQQNTDELSAAQKQTDERNQLRQHYIELCSQRDSVWKDCDEAEIAVTNLLQYAEQTATLLSNCTIPNTSYTSSKEQLSKLSKNYQSTVVQIHNLLSKHAPHVKAYHNDSVQRKGSGDNGGNSIYIQRVEQRLAEMKRRLLQDLIATSDYVENNPTPALNTEQATTLLPNDSGVESSTEQSSEPINPLPNPLKRPHD